ncbi:MAG: DUF1996 domain-containing protein [Thermoleophilia bacterium]|nr:DUF1996 domain-containing protein [Thermoleophilia bacterium]
MAGPDGAGEARAAPSRRLAVAALALSAALTAAATAQLPPEADGRRAPQRPFSDGAYFLVVCAAAHRDNDDPIVMPGRPGRSHNHTYVGNGSTDAFSTPESLRRHGASSCQPNADASAYWFPTLYAGSRAVLPLVAIVYYIRRTAAAQPFPAGLRVIAGNARATRPRRRRSPTGPADLPFAGAVASRSSPTARSGAVSASRSRSPTAGTAAAWTAATTRGTWRTPPPAAVPPLTRSRCRR